MDRPTTKNLCLAAMLASFAGPGHAGTILLSGDSNLANPLWHSFLTEPVEGNRRLFRNVLDGGKVVRILESRPFGAADLADTDIDLFFNTIEGVSSSTMTGFITPESLGDVDLFVSVLPDDPFRASELDALSGFLDADGTVFFLGENRRVEYVAANQAINSALATLGSELRVVPDLFGDGRFHDLLTASIAQDAFSAGVNSIRYAGASAVSGGTPLIHGPEQQVLLAYEAPRTVLEPPGLAGMVITVVLLLGLCRRPPRAFNGCFRR